MKELIETNTKVQVHLAENASDCVVKGCATAIDYIADVESADKTNVNPLLAAY